MPSLPSYFVAIACGTVLGLGACGGGVTRPGPLKHHLDDMYLARVPLEDKQSVIEAQQDYHVAKMERAKAEADYGESATDLKVAKNERQQAVIDEKSAQAKKESADKSADLNRINTAALQVRQAKLARRAAEKKVEYMAERRKYLKKYMYYAEDKMYAEEARYELAKARLAQEKNIRPRGFVMANYQKQAKERSQHAQRTKAILDRHKARLDKLYKEWKALEREAHTAPTTSTSTGTASPGTSPDSAAGAEDSAGAEAGQ